MASVAFYIIEIEIVNYYQIQSANVKTRLNFIRCKDEEKRHVKRIAASDS